jgi:hypothetical protein
MNKTSYAVLGSLAGFAVGISVYFLKERPLELPVSPPGVLMEFDGQPGPRPVRVSISPADLRRLEQEVAAIEHDQQVFRREFAQLNQGFQKRLNDLLTPDQISKLAASRETSAEAKHSAVSAPQDASKPRDVLRSSPLPIDGVAPHTRSVLPPQVLESMVELTFVSWSTANLDSALELSPEQIIAVRALLEERRARFLELVDRVPPPSLRMLGLTKAKGE